MQNKDTVLGKLISELEAVTEHFMIQRRSFGDYVVATFVTGDHSGPNVQTVPASVTCRVNIDGIGPTLEAAVDDALQKIALSAPQQVSA